MKGRPERLFKGRYRLLEIKETEKKKRKIQIFVSKFMNNQWWDKP